MSRDIDSAFTSAATAEIVYPSLFAKFDFPSSALRVWSGTGTYSWFGQDWLGVGKLGGVTTVAENRELQASQVQFQLSGIPASEISTSLTEEYQNRPCQLWLAMMSGDDSSTATVDSYYLLFEGLMDQMTIVDDPGNPVIYITAENRLIDLFRNREVRYTDQAQQQIFPGDTFFDLMAYQASRPINWGRADTAGVDHNLYAPAPNAVSPNP